MSIPLNTFYAELYADIKSEDWDESSPEYDFKDYAYAASFFKCLDSEGNAISPNIFSHKHNLINNAFLGLFTKAVMHPELMTSSDHKLLNRIEEWHPAYFNEQIELCYEDLLAEEEEEEEYIG